MFRNIEAEIDPANARGEQRTFVVEDMTEMRVRILAAEVLSCYSSVAQAKRQTGWGLQDGSLAHQLAEAIQGCGQGDAASATLRYKLPKLEVAGVGQGGLRVFAQHLLVGDEEFGAVVFGIAINQPLTESVNRAEFARQIVAVLNNFDTEIAGVADGAFADASLPTHGIAYEYNPAQPLHFVETIPLGLAL